MRIHIELSPETRNLQEVNIGNVYAHRGGRGMKFGHMHVIMGISEDRMCACLTVDKAGFIIGGTSYCLSYFEDKLPIAFVDGLNDIDLTMRSL